MIDPGELGPETPAVVDLLVHGGEPSGNAVAATVLDLAARGHVELEEASPGRYLCRLPRGHEDGALTPYEVQVMALLRDRARDRVVPAEALTAGTYDETSEWWASFRRHVHAHARDLGLIGSGWELVLGILFVVVGAGSVAYWWWYDSWVAVLVFGIVFAAGMVFTLIPDDRLRPDRLTRHGRAVRGRWERRRHELGATGGFVDVPPTGVAIWDRYLGYAAALGLAPAACHPLPLGPDSTKVAWVRRDGEWRRLPVCVPHRFLPGSGRRAVVGLAIGLAALAAGSAVLVAAVRRGRWHPSPPFSDDVADAIGDVEPLAVMVALLLIALGLWELWRSVPGMNRVVDGTIVSRCVRQGWRANPWRDVLPPAYFIVVDDGTSEVLDGWRVSSDEFVALTRGEPVTVWIDTRIPRVRAIQPAEKRPAATPALPPLRGRGHGGRGGAPSS